MATQFDFEEIARFTEAFGIPAHEEEISELLKGRLAKLGYKVEFDMMGDVIAYSPAFDKKSKPMVIAAHMDEIGMLVKYVSKKGFLKFAKIGGIDSRMLPNQRVIVKTKKGKIFGVIGTKPPHVTKASEMDKAYDAQSMFIDIGAKSDKEARKMGVEIGDPISFEMDLARLGNDLVTGKALDDRIGCFALVEIAKRLKAKNVVIVGTVQEEVSTFGKGAMISAWNLEPSSFIAVDTSVAGDHPEMREEDGAVCLGKGPAITMVEASGRGNVVDKRLAAMVLETAKKLKIPCQLEVVEGGATDASSVYNLKGGIPSVAICVPSRYIHSNVSVCSLADLKRTIDLVVGLALKGKF